MLAAVDLENGGLAWKGEATVRESKWDRVGKYWVLTSYDADAVLAVVDGESGVPVAAARSRGLDAAAVGDGAVWIAAEDRVARGAGPDLGVTWASEGWEWEPGAVRMEEIGLP